MGSLRSFCFDIDLRKPFLACLSKLFSLSTSKRADFRSLVSFPTVTFCVLEVDCIRLEKCYLLKLFEEILLGLAVEGLLLVALDPLCDHLVQFLVVDPLLLELEVPQIGLFEQPLLLL